MSTREGDRSWGESGNKINDLHLGKERKDCGGGGVGGGGVRLRADLASHP